jgi:nucleoside-specific outer membrane channel protein Tsx
LIRKHLFRTLTALALAAALLPSAARADFATTNLQAIDGWYFYDPTTGSDVVGGQMGTVTLNHFSAWKYGDVFGFVDLLQGSFRDGNDSHVYSEVHPRLFVNRMLGSQGKVLGIFKDAGFAGEVNFGNGFQAYLAGVGGDFAVGFGTLSLNVYYRYDALQIPGFSVRNYNHTWQVSPSWVIPFQLADVGFLFTGFVDMNGVKAGKGWKGYEVMAQPELLVDVVGLLGGPKNKFLAGVEWYLHYHPNNELLGAPNNLISAPQAMLQWNLH